MGEGYWSSPYDINNNVQYSLTTSPFLPIAGNTIKDDLNPGTQQSFNLKIKQES